MSASLQTSATIDPIVPAGFCPLCRRPNACPMAAPEDGSAGATPCWCVAATISPAALARASALDGGTACVCAACAAEAP